MLEAVHLTKVYKTKGGTDVRALDNVSLRFSERGMVFLLGKSGSGKSTLLNLVAGLESPTDGSINVLGQRKSSSRAEAAKTLRRAISTATATPSSGLYFRNTISSTNFPSRTISPSP